MNTNLPGNPYEVNPDDFDAASDCRTLDCDYATSDAILREAQVRATLALAHEVRTANLIALLDHLRSNTEYGGAQADWHQIQDQITTRLGLDKETPDADH